MAVTYPSFSSSSSSSCITVQKSGIIMKPISKVWMFQPRYFPRKKSLTLQIRSSIKNKVFEDQSEGIICYSDENGEVTCEGYDEGPRFHQEIPSKSVSHKRDVEIIDLLMKQSLLQIVKGGGSEVKRAAEKEGVAAVKEDLKVNGFDSFC